MKIGFDAKRIVKNTTGLGNYSRYIVNSLLEYYPDNEYQLYVPTQGDQSLQRRIKSHTAISYLYPDSFFTKKFPSYWRSFGIEKDLVKNKIDLFHGLSNEIPLNLKKNQIKSVVTIHDLIFLRYPELYSFIDSKLYNYKYGNSAKKADRIIAISEQTKKDIIQYWKIKEDKIDVVYQGCDTSFSIKKSREDLNVIRNKYSLSTPYILYIGSIEERKNLLLLIKALKNIPEDISVIAIGKRTSYTNKVENYIKENNLQSRVKILNNIPFYELPGFYQMAQLFVYPSFFEGFGIPILEALNSGIPVIGATGSCLEEAGGPDSLYTNPNNPDELSSLILSILKEPCLAENMILKGKIYAKRFTASTISRDIMEIYKKIY